MKKLVRINQKYFLENDTIPYSGKAYDLYQDNKIRFYIEYMNGIAVKYIHYWSNGKILVEENYKLSGEYSGKYFSGNEMGDTLQLGFYKGGKKNGKWIIIDSDSVKALLIYKNDSIVHRK